MRVKQFRSPQFDCKKNFCKATRKQLSVSISPGLYRSSARKEETLGTRLSKFKETQYEMLIVSEIKNIPCASLKTFKSISCSYR